jgi:membrane protein implicated in regulation of membrane protease activity
LTTLLLILGLAAIVAGVAAWSWPAALIVAGCALVILAVLFEAGKEPTA